MKKRFGQHFLFDKSILRRIVAFAEIGPRDTVVEIGAGRGSLTRELAAAAGHVVAIEIDRDLIPLLREQMPANVQIIEGDALEVDFEGLWGEPFHVAGNLPYNIATPLLKRLIDVRRQIRDVTVMIQKEVADRIAARPASAAYGPLSILVQYYCFVKYGFTVAAGAFRPAPKVDSAVIRLEWRPDVEQAAGFTDFVHRAFSFRRKKLANNLAAMFPALTRRGIQERLRAANLAANARAEELSIPDFLRVYNQFR